MYGQVSAAYSDLCREMITELEENRPRAQTHDNGHDAVEMIDGLEISNWPVIAMTGARRVWLFS
jgi:hypothetical protein